ncbi:hypothetical protein ED733_003359 [Metarhizium rileyi]|uniref:Uncharacterized protein n=1 Tax=Metarhizium rileyi (strain RCEF 4871) TaxID=1649241 RepID=A0A5C6GAS8_METRR|nr:hypothetical protein ED733_003359 [Metarhizium rileyi]
MYGPPKPRKHHAGRSSTQSPPRLAGRIMWLPTKDTMDLGLEHGVYNHPVVVVSSVPHAGDVDFFPLTSLGGRGLTDRFPADQRARSRYLPIKPSARHPDNKLLLELSGEEDRLTKDSYIHIARVLRAKLHALRPYRSQPRRPFHLSDSSYRQLVQQTGYDYRPRYLDTVALGDSAPTPPSPMVVRVQRSRVSARYELYYGAISQPRPVQRSFAYPQVDVPGSNLHNERTRLLPPVQMANFPQSAHAGPSWTRKVRERMSRGLSAVNWWNVLGFVLYLVAMASLCYGIYWVVHHLVLLLVACWEWLKHSISTMVDDITTWVSDLFGHADVI